MTGTFTLSGGGDPTTDGVKHADASVGVPINEITLGDTSGSGSLGPQPLEREPLTGGGALDFISPHHPTAGFTLSGGGALSANASIALTGTLTLAGGGALLATGVFVAAFTLTGGGTLAVTGHAAAVLSGGGALTFHVVKIDPNAVRLPFAELLMETYPLIVGTPPEPGPPGLVITLVDDTIESPGSLVAIVGNGTPEGPVVFSIVHMAVSTDVMSTDFDDTGAVGGVSVPVNVATETTYQLVATDTTTSDTASVSFTVTAINTAVTIGVPVTTPPTHVQPGSGVKRWVFQDPANSDVYHFPINPHKMNSPFAPKRILFQATTAIDGAKLAFEGQAAPVEWQFEGVLFSQAHYDALVTWFHKRNRIWITDHYGRAWLTYLTVFSPTPRRSTNPSHYWAHDWTMTALIFEGPVTPT